MKIIVGLGNPGKKYELTRHNIGFMAVDFYMKDKESIKCESRFKGQVCEMQFMVREGNDSTNSRMEKIFFVKPQTFMNNSGEAVAEIIQFYKADPETDLLVVHDEIDLKFGFYKRAFDSRPAGHNGIKSIVEHLGSQKFHRVRVGIESRLSRHESPTEEFVLRSFTPDELDKLTANILPQIALEIEQFIRK